MTTPAQQTSAALSAQLANGSLVGNWTLDPARSTATLRSKSMWGLVPVKGVFRDLDGGGTVSPEGEVSGRIEVATGSVDTKNARRATHLRSADFFLSEEHPVIVVALAKLVPGSDDVTVSGTLTVRERSLPITFPATVTLTGEGEALLDATAEVDRSEFGLTWNQLGLSSMKTTITVHAVFTRN